MEKVIVGCWLTSFAMGIVSMPCLGLEVIYRDSNAVAYQHIVKSEETGERTQNELMQSKKPASAFPLSSEILTVGDVESKAVNLKYMPFPVYFVGTDNRSKAWVVQHHDVLKSINAVGVIVAAENEQAVQIFLTGIEDLPMKMVSVDDVIRNAQLPVKHYPVLITNSVIEQ